MKHLKKLKKFNGEHINSNGTQRWYKDGELHREDGPSIIYTDGSKLWYINGKELTEQQFTQWYREKRLKQLLK